MAKGKGHLRLTMITKLVLDTYAPANQWGHIGYSFDADSTGWQRISIPVDSLRPMTASPQEADGLTWAQCRDAVTSIVIGSWESIPGDTVELMIDDVRLIGVAATDVH